MTRLAATTLCIFTVCATTHAQNARWDQQGAIQVQVAKIEIKDEVEIAAEVPGRIVTLNPEAIGGVVESGQLVVEIDSQLVAAQLDEAILEAEDEVLIEFAEIKLKHAVNDLQDKKDRNARANAMVFSETEIRRLELDVEQARAELKQAKYNQKKARQAVETKRVELSQYKVQADFPGIVTDLHKKCVGSSVRQGDPIMTIVNLAEVQAVLTVTPDDYARIQLGDTVLVRQTTRTESDRGGEGAGGDSPFRSTFRSSARPTPASVSSPELREEVTFVGKVTHFSNTAKTDEENSLQVVAVIQNKLGGPRKYMLREGSYIRAQIIPQR